MTGRAGCRVALVGVALAGAPAWASFTPGQVYLVSPALPNESGGAFQGVLRIDPVTWATQSFAVTNMVMTGRAAYDPARDRIVFASNVGLRTMDALGVVGAAALPGPAFSDYPAPGAGGRLYFAENLAGGPISYLDSADVVHALLAPDGVAQAGVESIDALWYDAPTNSLLACDDSVAGQTRISRLALTPGGDRVTAVSSVVIDVSTTDELGVGFSAGPGGLVFLKIDDNATLEAARMQLIDPATLAASPFASSNYFGVPSEVAGVYAPAIGKAIVLDSLGDALRTFGFGESGEGAIVLAAGVSAAGSGERSQLIVVPPALCPSDLSGDGVTDGADLGLLLGAWGTPAGDLNGDGTTDGADLGLLLGQWGDCTP